MTPRVLLLAGCLLLGAPAAAAAGGQLMVTPTRLVLEGRTRAGEVTLINAGAEPATYRITFSHLEMDEDGRLHDRPRVPGTLAAEDLIRFSPRQVTLGPGEGQVVRIQVRKPAALAEGEYRSHLLFRAVPAAPAHSGQPLAEREFSVAIRAVYGVSIPLIVRHGVTQAQAALSDLRLEPHPGTQATLHLRLHRDGNRSLYGNLVATWQPRGGKPVAAGCVNGIAVYTGVAARKVSLRVAEVAQVGAGPGTLQVSYQEPDTGKVLAQASLDWP